MSSREKGYVYFQEFIPNNKFDTRIVVVGSRAAAARRMVRKNDFRASGNGNFCYDNINLKAVEIAFNIAEKLKLQSVAFDFVEDEHSNPSIIEISYGFGTSGIIKVLGYWDSTLKWHNEEFKPQECIIECLIKSL